MFAMKASILFVWLLLLAQPKLASSFAAKKKKGGGKKKATASTNKGFGAPPPTFEEVLTKFKTRMPEDADNQICPCNTVSGRLYKDCCGPLHKGEKQCLTMSDVLRSRYSAFSWRNIRYVIQTTHKTSREYMDDPVVWAKDLNKGGMFDSFDFVKLEAGPEEEGSNENEGFIDFKVTLRTKVREDADPDLVGQETVVTERSKFLRNEETGIWSYAAGDVRSDVQGLRDVQLNA